MGQRTKTLQSLLSWSPESTHPISLANGTAVHKTNGHPPETKITKSASGSLAKPILAVKHATQTALYTIIKTVKNARDIFQEDASGHSLVGTVLEYIQTDSPSSLPHTAHLPTELQLTTQTLLTTLPSSTHFLLLPPALRSYKPYVDLHSSSSSVPQSQFVQRLDDWFRKSTEHLQTAMQRWFSDLQSVREVWNIRTSMRHWILSSPGLGEQEVGQVKSIIDYVCNERVLAIWKSALDDAEMAFQKQLGVATSSLGEGSNAHRIGKLPTSALKSWPFLIVFCRRVSCRESIPSPATTCRVSSWDCPCGYVFPKIQSRITTPAFRPDIVAGRCSGDSGKLCKITTARSCSCSRDRG